MRGRVHSRALHRLDRFSGVARVLSRRGGAGGVVHLVRRLLHFPGRAEELRVEVDRLGAALGQALRGRETRSLSRGDGDESEARAAHLPLVTAQQAEATKSARDVLLTRERAVQLQAELVEALGGVPEAALELLVPMLSIGPALKVISSPLLRCAALRCSSE